MTLPCTTLVSSLLFLAVPAVSAEEHPILRNMTITDVERGRNLEVVTDDPLPNASSAIQSNVRVVNTPSARTEWTLTETDKGWTIQAERAGPVAGWYQGEKKKVGERFVSHQARLVDKPGPGSYWKLTRTETPRHNFQATLQAASGRFKDWYLDFDQQEEQIIIGKHSWRASKVILSDKPSPRSKLHIFIDGP